MGSKNKSIPPHNQRSSSPKTTIPKPKKPPVRNKWRFSFAYWKQVDYFGLDCKITKTSGNWFVSLLERLKELSSKTVEEVMVSGKVWRYHPINWDQKNIPIQKEELTWLPKEVIDAEEQIELYQIQISQALGRIVGFHDDEDIFQIVLLDPEHNIQPSKDYDFEVNPTKELLTPYQRLKDKIFYLKKEKENQCSADNCSIELNLNFLLDESPMQGRALYLDDMLLNEIEQIFNESEKGQYDNLNKLYEIVLEALILLREQNNNLNK
jgi:hypothetical protein